MESKNSKGKLLNILAAGVFTALVTAVCIIAGIYEYNNQAADKPGKEKFNIEYDDSSEYTEKDREFDSHKKSDKNDHKSDKNDKNEKNYEEDNYKNNQSEENSAKQEKDSENRKSFPESVFGSDPFQF